MDPRSFYEVGRSAASLDVAREERTTRIIGSLRLLVVLAAIALLAALVWTDISRMAWAAVIVLVLAFVGLVVLHQRAFARQALATARRRFHERGVDRLSLAWARHPRDGLLLREVDHPYADDLDIFGPSSLFQLMNDAETPFGEGALAQILAPPPLTLAGKAADVGVSAGDELRDRQVATRELADKSAFRERLSAVAHVVSSEKPDPTPFVEWVEKASPFELSPVVVALLWVLPILAISLMAFGKSVGFPGWTWVVVVLGELALLAAFRKVTVPILAAASSKEGALGRFAEVFALIEGEAFDAPLLRALKERLGSGGGATATREMGTLGRILSFVDARQNEVFRAFIAPVLLWDLHCALALERWRRRVGPHVRGWFQILGQFEARSSLGGFAFNHPSFCWPELVDPARFEARALGHPLVDPVHRVDNDVAIPGAGRALVITGSNMSGKSTLLRAMGLNSVLALAGAPTCAASFVLGRVQVATSMRVSDSLAAGVSHFLAELQRLKRVVDLAEGGTTVLFLLDEILHGTNSRERLIGARAIVGRLADLGAFGAVSTHDLGITEPVIELVGRVENVHFEEQIDEEGRMTFDYRLRSGVVKSSNALRLMKAIGLPVTEVGEGAQRDAGAGRRDSGD